MRYKNWDIGNKISPEISDQAFAKRVLPKVMSFSIHTNTNLDHCIKYGYLWEYCSTFNVYWCQNCWYFCSFGCYAALEIGRLPVGVLHNSKGLFTYFTVDSLSQIRTGLKWYSKLYLSTRKALKYWQILLGIVKILGCYSYG